MQTSEGQMMEQEAAAADPMMKEVSADESQSCENWYVHIQYIYIANKNVYL